MVKILVIDESDQVCRTVKRGLEHIGGYWVFVAQNWQDGLKLARSAQPALILLDIDMQDIDGIDFPRQLRNNARTRCIPVVAMSTSDDRETRQRSSQACVERYITKPFEIQQLQMVLHQALTFRGIRTADAPLVRSSPLEAA